MIAPLIVLTVVGPEKAPAEVIVPLPVVEIFPVVVMASPAVEGERLVPVLDQYPSIPEVAQVLPEIQTVPEASGNVYVLAPVKSTEVRVPVNLVDPPTNGRIAN